MASYQDQPRDLSMVPADPKLFGVLLAAAIVAFVLAVSLSGVRWWRLPVNPWLWFRASIDEASQRGEQRFWLTWTLLGFAVVFAAAAFVVGCVLLYRP